MDGSTYQADNLRHIAAPRVPPRRVKACASFTLLDHVPPSFKIPASWDASVVDESELALLVRHRCVVLLHLTSRSTLHTIWASGSKLVRLDGT